MFTKLPVVIVRPGEADRIIAGHPWIYQGCILRITAPANDGDLVAVKDHRQRFLGVGMYNSRSKINVRLLTPEREDIDRNFFERKIKEALSIRTRRMPKASSFRVVNAESDFLSGLIVDKYEDVLSLQTSSLGMDQRKQTILEILQSLFKPKAIVERNEMASRKFEGLPDANGVIYGKLEDQIQVNLNGLSFATDLRAGHKTGLYLDQQDNYQRVAEMIRPGDNVLDCFTFMGGFALHAARAKAGRVLALDQSAEAIEMATRNAKANSVDSNCLFETANVFDWLKSQTVTPPHEKLIPRYDFIILDPPSFTRNRAAIPDAMRGYKEIHIRALKLLKPGGTLATFCCSHHVDAVMFQDVILAAAYDARRILRRTATFSQAPDHPVVPMIPETEYLKGFAFELVR